MPALMAGAGRLLTDAAHRGPATCAEPAPGDAAEHAGRCRQLPAMTSRISRAVSLGVRPTRTPAFSSASFLACAVPAEPEMIAPAWPIVLPSGAVKPAT